MDTTIAIIPARSGSKGFRNKNISTFNNNPLMASSINFAKKLDFVDKVICLTDSKEYANIASDYGAEIPYLRELSTSSDSAMEEDILEEFKSYYKKNATILWLRPTHPLREKKSFEEAYHMFTSGKYSSVCVVTKAESRIYYNKNGVLQPFNSLLQSKSMWRRQDIEAGYKLYHGEIFSLPSTYDINFLGKKIGFVEQNSKCSFDIDDAEDLDYLNYKIKSSDYASLLH